MTEARNKQLPENYDRSVGETSFSNPVFEDGNTQVLTSDNNHLIAGETRVDVYTEPGNPPSAELAADSIRRDMQADEFDAIKKRG